LSTRGDVIFTWLSAEVNVCLRSNRSYKRGISIACIATILSSTLLCTPQWAFADEALDIYAKMPNSAASKNLIADAGSGVDDRNQFKLSADSLDLIGRLNLQPKFDRYKALSEQLAGYRGQPPSIEKLALHQDVGDARHELAQTILKLNLEVDYVLAVIDGEQNKFNEVLTEMVAKRDKSVWLSTVLSQWSNGILWATSSSFSIGTAYNPQMAIPEGIIGILAGVIPTALALRSLRQMNGEKRELLGYPNMLAPVFERGHDEEAFYPTSVWNWLNQVPAKSKEAKTRRQMLIDKWKKSNYVWDEKKANAEVHLAALTGTLGKKREMTIALLQNRQAMLTDLRTEVVQLKRALLELINSVD